MNTHILETLLLTGTIAPFANLKKCHYRSTTTDHNLRYREYLKAIIYYITQSDFTNITFCENSNYDIPDTHIIKELAKTYNKNIELLKFKGDASLIEKYGYGIGEGEILDYAYEHSLYIKGSENFYKITGRYIIPNINQILSDYSKQDIFFYKGRRPEIGQLFITTAFLKCPISLFTKYIYKKIIPFYHKNAGNKNIILENTFYILLRDVILQKEIKITGIPDIINYFDYKTGTKIDRSSITRTLKLFIFNKLGLLGYGMIHKLIDKLKYKKLLGNYRV